MTSAGIGRKVARLVAVCALLSFVFSPQSLLSRAEAAEAGIKPSWTKIQDLNPNAPSANQAIKRKWAVVVGLDKFAEHRLNADNKQVEAANEFAAFLEDSHGGKFEKSHVKLLTNADATQHNISNAVGKEWLGRLAGPDDLVVIFMATSSFPTTDGGSYLCTYNCSLDNVMGTCLSIKDFMEELKKQVNCNRIILVLQSCYSGAAQLTSGAKTLSSPSSVSTSSSTPTPLNFNPDSIVSGKGFVIISSSRPEQMSWSKVFSTNLIGALREEDGMIHLRDAFVKARDATVKETAGNPAQSVQTPVMKYDWKGTDIVLGAKAVEDSAELPESVRAYVGAESHYLAANRLVEAGKPDAAIAEYKLALASEPDYADVLADYGSVLAMKADFNGGAQLYKRALEIKPDDALLHSNYARILSKLGSKNEAVAELETAYKLNPQDVGVVTVLADRYAQAGGLDRAQELLDKALTTQPKSAKLHDRLGFILSKQGNIEGAVTHAREAVKLDASLVSARLNLGSLLLASGDPKGALEEYRSAVQAAPTNADAHYMLAGALEESGDVKAAQNEFDQFVQLASPSDARSTKVKDHLQELLQQQQQQATPQKKR